MTPTEPRVTGSRRRFAWLRRWHTSLQLRVILTAGLVGLVAMTALGLYQTYQIRDGLFGARLTEALRESATSAERARDQFGSSATDSLAQVNQLASDTVKQLKSTSPSGRDVVLISTPAALTFNDSTTSLAARVAVTDGLRQSVQRAGPGVAVWQSVALEGQTPGLVIGNRVTLPGDRPGELYFVYDLHAEQATLALTERVLGLGALFAVIVLFLVAFVVTRQVVRPVSNAASVAERLASGQLSERMTVRGEDELARLASSFNEMATSLQTQIEQLAQLSTMQRQFVSDVSHELRTPLTTIKMAGEVLYERKDSYPAPVARSAELLLAEVDRFEALLVDLLEISRHDAGAAELDAQDRDLREVVDAALQDVASLAEERGVELRRTMCAEPARADLDARRIERIARNLLVNAIEHAEGNPVDVYVDANTQAVALVVRDHGCGMSPQAVSHAFDRFWRADPARTRTTGGTGLGLAIATEDARLHGGRLEAWGEEGEGASFRLLLPRRAGMTISRSPLELVPPAPDHAGARRRHDDPADPAALPSFAMVTTEE